MKHVTELGVNDWQIFLFEVKTLGGETVEHRAGADCMERYYFLITDFKGNLEWSIQEDVALKNAVTLYGQENWRFVASKVAGRGASQCKFRWSDYIDSAISWNEVEDFNLTRTVDYCRGDFERVKYSFPSRTLHALETRWKYYIFPRKHTTSDISAIP